MPENRSVTEVWNLTWGHTLGTPPPHMVAAWLTRERLLGIQSGFVQLALEESWAGFPHNSTLTTINCLMIRLLVKQAIENRERVDRVCHMDLARAQLPGSSLETEFWSRQ